MGMAEFPDEFLRTPKTTIQSGVLIINVNNNHYQLLIYPIRFYFYPKEFELQEGGKRGNPRNL